MEQDLPDGLDRRRLLKGLGAAATGAFAGCTGQDGDDTPAADEETPPPTATATETATPEPELGERVPEPIVFAYGTGLGATTQAYETISTVLRDDIRNAFNLEVEVEQREIVSLLGDLWGDERNWHLSTFLFATRPAALDPNWWFDFYRIAGAGGGGRNFPGYADCEFERYVEESATAPTQGARREAALTALETISQDINPIGLASGIGLSAVRTDEVEVKGTGVRGVSQTNPHPFIYSEPTAGDSYVTKANPPLFQSRNFLLNPEGQVDVFWNSLVHSPLIEYDENFAITNVLASDYTVSEGGSKITFELREATFHNGDPVTAEDVAFTFEHVWTTEEYGVPKSEFESITVVDDRTVEFDFGRPALQALSFHFPIQGILHKATWEAADDDPSGFEFDPIVGSGPLAVRTYSTGQLIEVVPHDGHPVHQPASTVIFSSFQDNSTAVQAFLANEIQMLPSIREGDVQQIRSSLPDRHEIVVEEKFTNYNVQTSNTNPPTSFRDFRAALAKAIDRDLVNELLADGELAVEQYSCLFGRNHPFRPPDDRLYRMTDTGSSDLEGARQVLRDAGWGWDENDDLRYPAGFDSSPPWPAGEGPDPADFPCLNEEGEYVEGWWQ